MKKTLLATALLAGIASGGAIALTGAAPASAQMVPYAAPGFQVGRHHVDGRIVDSRPFFIAVRVGPQVIPVHLHQGTVILPTGTTLEPGMRVAVEGNWGDGGRFFANRIVLH